MAGLFDVVECPRSSPAFQVVPGDAPIDLCTKARQLTRDNSLGTVGCLLHVDRSRVIVQRPLPLRTFDSLFAIHDRFRAPWGIDTCRTQHR